MTRRPVTTGQFQRDLRRMERRGKDPHKLREVMSTILRGESLPVKMRDHQLKGIWRGRRECHVEPDWLLIYLLQGDNVVVFERTGRHADLFD